MRPNRQLDGWTDSTKLIVAFLNFANTTKTNLQLCLMEVLKKTPSYVHRKRKWGNEEWLHPLGSVALDGGEGFLVQ